MACSILLLTHNEGVNILACLESAGWCDDVVVVDSGSTDDTVNVATARGARVFSHAWEGFAAQRNWALDHVEFKYRWVFHLDADERFTPALVEEVRKVVREDGLSGYLVPSQLMLEGRWLKHAGLYPSYQMRLGKIGEVRFEQVGHGQRETGAVRGLGRLREPYLHYPHEKGIGDWVSKHRQYALDEARRMQLEIGSKLDLAGIVSLADPVRRRRALKAVSYRLPFRPAVRFLYMYLLRLGFLDGGPGFRYCRMIAQYQSEIDRQFASLRKDVASR